MTELQRSGDDDSLATFSQCVVGYRSWGLGKDGQLWPLRGRPQAWQPAVNTARCDCGTSDRLHFEWSILDGRRVLEPAPLHDAPGETCRCGLYSMREPKTAWGQTTAFLQADRVAGAIASWGRVQVHGTGIRAEHACILALAIPDHADTTAVQKIQRAAARYSVDVVPLSEIKAAAAQHGAPLPDTLHAAAEDRAEEVKPDPTVADDWAPARNASEDEVDQANARTQAGPRPLAVRRRYVFLTIVALLAAVIILLIAVDHRSTPCKLQILGSGTGGTIERCASNAPSNSNH